MVLAGREPVAFYLYAITDAPAAPLPACRGFGDAPLLDIPCGGVAAVVSGLPVASVPATPSNLWLHEGIAEELMATRATLPMRFGTTLPDVSRVQAVLAENRTSFRDAVDRVRGRVEVGLRVFWPADARRPADPVTSPSAGDPRASPGRQYMMALVREQKRISGWQDTAAALAEAIHRPLVALAVHSTTRILPSPRTVLTAAYLIDRARLEAIRSAVGDLASAFPHLDFLCTGPWPPYHFVEIG